MEASVKPVQLELDDSGELYTLQPSKVIGVGLNYMDHLQESGQRKPPPEPVLFPKLPSCIIGPGDPIQVSKFVFETLPEYRMDYEAELGVVISKLAKNVPQRNALDYVLGFACFNDVSLRNFQFADKSGWFRGKSLDTFAPIGPRIATPGRVGDVQALEIKLWLNGELRQHGNTRDMLFPVAELVSFISKNFALWPGDVIATGTPAGVGPMKPGDTVAIEIDGIGRLENPVEQA